MNTPDFMRDFYPPPWNISEHPEKTEGWIEYQKEMIKDPQAYGNFSWISVKDRLPQCGEWVLVFAKVNGETLIDLALLDITIGFVNPTLGHGCMKGVSHWMPFPGPPNE